MDKPFPAYKGEGAYVFVCYAHADAEVVYPEIAWLREQAINIWYDEGISAGKVWRAEIAEAIRGAHRILYYISSASLGSDHCNREIDYALDQTATIVPVHLDQTELTPEMDLALRRLQALRRTNDARYEHHLVSALGDTNSIPAAQKTPDSESGSAQAEILAQPTVEVNSVSCLSNDSTWTNYAEVITQDIKDALADHAGIVLITRGNRVAAEYTVDGNLRATNGGARVSIELQRLRDGHVVWREVLEELIDVEAAFEFQRAGHVAYAVESVLANAEYRHSLENSGAAKNLLALDAFFSGRAERDAARVGDGSWDVAMDHYRRAIVLDPEFVEPYAWLAVAYATTAQSSMSAEKARLEAHELVAQMRLLKPTPAVRFALAQVSLRLDLDYAQATRNIAHESLSSFPPHLTYMVKCQIALAQGHLNEAIVHCRSAASTGGSLEFYVLGLVLYIAGHYEDAVEVLHRSLARSDGSSTTKSMNRFSGTGSEAILDVLTRSQFRAGDVAAANATLDGALPRDGDRLPEQYAPSLALLGRTDEARRAINELVDRERRRTRTTAAAAQAFWAFFYLGDLDEAFVWMQRAIENREVMLIGAMRASPLLDGLREDSRFAAAMTRVEEIEAEGSPDQSVVV